MSSVLPPNKSDTDRTAVDSDIEQPGGGTEGTADRLNEAPRCCICHQPMTFSGDGKFRCLDCFVKVIRGA